MFVKPQNTPLGPVGKRFIAHGAGIDNPYGIKKLIEAVLTCPLIDAEDTFVFTGKGVAEIVFQKAAGADNYGRLAKIV